MKIICEKINNCGECPYFHFTGHSALCNHIGGPSEKLENLYIWNDIHPKCPLSDLHLEE